jgi:uncharacterized protein YndB with AHSA1/START domain
MIEKDSIEMSWIVAAPPSEVYDHWTTTAGHTAMTGGVAEVDGREGGHFTAWDGYIRGVTEKLEQNRLIVQTWRTAEFADAAPDSRIEVRLRDLGGSTQVTVRHTDLSPGEGAKYTTGWFDFYLRPMVAYFEAAK